MTEHHSLSALERITAVPGMLASGTASIVLSKVMFEMSAHGKKFAKPWYQTWIMFIGMMICLLPNPGQVRAYFCGKKKEDASVNGEGSTLLNGNASNGDSTHGTEEVAAAFVMTKRQLLKILPPAACDMVATGLMMIGLIFIPASVFQLFRGSIIIFTAILSVMFLKKKLYAYNVVALVLVVIALMCVGLAAILSQAGGSDTKHQLIGMSLVVVAQLIQASQTVIEEFLLKDVCAPPSQVVGAEGVWGTLLCTFIVLPILYFIPESSGVGEDTIDTFRMMGINHWLIWMSLFSIAALLLFNQTGMIITLMFSAIFRTILEGIRTLCIWVTDLFIFYVIAEYYGEKWVVWSWLQLAGFAILIVGTFMYDRVFEVPGFTYPPKEDEEETTPLVVED